LKPVLIVTCRAGNEDWCIEEIGNVIFPLNHSVKVLRTGYPGLLIVYSKLDHRRVYSLVNRYEYGFVERIVPVVIYSELNKFDPRSILGLVVENEEVKLKVRVRGIRGLSSRLWKEIINVLSEKNVKHNSKAKTCLYVEVINNMIYIGKANC